MFKLKKYSYGEVCDFGQDLMDILYLNHSIRRHMDEVGNVTSLILALSSRLAKLETNNNINKVSPLDIKKNSRLIGQVQSSIEFD